MGSWTEVPHHAPADRLGLQGVQLASSKNCLKLCKSLHMCCFSWEYAGSDFHIDGRWWGGSLTLYLHTGWHKYTLAYTQSVSVWNKVSPLWTARARVPDTWGNLTHPIHVIQGLLFQFYTCKDWYNLFIELKNWRMTFNIFNERMIFNKYPFTYKISKNYIVKYIHTLGSFFESASRCFFHAWIFVLSRL